MTTISILGTVIGGVGLFLLGMILMTDGLKALAGDALRSILSRFTTNRFSALATGAGVTALVQSSSATTLATIGFVSAGLLSFQNAIGVIIGTNTDAALARLAAQRWLDRVAYHLWRTGHHLREMTREELAAQASTSDDAGMEDRQ